MRIFTDSCMEFFSSATVEKQETTAGTFWNLKPGWNNFQPVSPLRDFLDLQWIITTETRQNMTLVLRDFENKNYFAKNFVLDAGFPNIVRSIKTPGWLQVVDIWISGGPAQLVDVRGVACTNGFDTYQFATAPDFTLQTSAKVKNTKKGIEFTQEFQEPYQALLRSKNAFAPGSIYAEHISADSSTKVTCPGETEVYISGPVTICRDGERAAISETIISSNGGRVCYKAEALVAGNPTLAITRISEAPRGYGKNII